MRRLWILLLIIGCASAQPATPSQEFDAARVAFVSAAGDYYDELVKDNDQVKACYVAHSTLSPEEQIAECPPKISKDKRSDAMMAIQSANSAIIIIDSQISMGRPIDSERLTQIEIAITNLTIIVAGASN